MKKTKRIILILAIAIVANGLSFPVPLRAATAEYMKTVNPGERASLRGVAYAVYQISATNLPGDQGWCTNCSSGSRHTYAYTPEAKSTFSITVDGYSVLNYSSQSAGSGTIDLSRYTNTDAVITVPSNYTIKQTTTCDGGTYSGGGTCEPCGYSSTKTATVTGSIQLYGYPNVPVIKAQPSAAGGATDGSVTFTISAEKATSYRWQKVTAAGVTDLTDGTAEDGVIYSGTSTAQLTIQGLRSRLNGSSYRCVVTGAKGDQVTSSAAALNVTDVTAPKIDYAISPTGETTGSVTVTLRATDADSELAPKPYEYLGESHESGTFTISKNGTYEVYASDVNGNRAKAEIRISNIVPPKKEEITPTPTPKATPVITPAPQQNTPVATEPQTIVIEKVTTQEPSQVPAPVLTPVPSATPLPVTSGVKNVKKKTDSSKEDENKKKRNESAANSVNIKNLTGGTNTGVQKEAEEATEQVEVEEEVMLSEAPEEVIEPEAVEEDDTIKTVTLACAGSLLLLLLAMAVMLFAVRIENADELGNWHFCALKMLRYHHGWELKLDLLLEDFDELRVKFGMLFLALIGDGTLKVLASEGESLTVREVTQGVILRYRDLGR